MKSLDHKLIRNLWKIRGQALAIALVIASAVATIVLSSGTYHSLELTRRLYYDRYHFADVFANLKRAPDSLSSQIDDISGVSRAQTGIRQYALLDMPSVIEPVRGLIISLAPEGQTGLNIPVLREGRWPQEDVSDEILVHESFADGHGLHPGDHISATINGKKKTLAIAGIALSPEFVYAIGLGDLVPDNRRFGIFWMNRNALGAAGNLEGAFNDVAVQLEKTANPNEVIASLDRLLKPYGGTGAFSRKDQISDAFVESELKQLRTMTMIMPPIFLVTAVFLLNIAMGRLVETERGNIGLLKAIGYGDGVIGVHYLRTAVIITTFGILIGWVAGLWMGRGMTQLYIEYYKFPVLQYHISLGVFFGSAFISLGASCAGTYFAIRKAVTLPPASAMISSAPACLSYWLDGTGGNPA
jgi:putative ABC transport system permease protein